MRGTVLTLRGRFVAPVSTRWRRLERVERAVLPRVDWFLLLRCVPGRDVLVSTAMASGQP